MVLPYHGNANYPGPLGLSGRANEWQIPGVLGFKTVDVTNGKATTKATTTVDMPPPWNNADAKRVGRVLWKLGNGDPDPADVQQGGLPNCPVAAILAALANTAAGRKYLNDIITEYTHVSIKTKLSPAIIKAVNDTTDDPDDHQQVPEIISDRYFKVPMWSGPIADTFYIQYADNDYTKPIFMGSPTQSLWPLVIEKACAFHYGSYKELGMVKNHTANEHWELVVGKKPQGGLEIKSSTDLTKIENLADRATQVPTLAASIDGAKKVTPDHAFAILGRSSSKINLYNPYSTKVSLTTEEFRENFQTILFGTP